MKLLVRTLLTSSSFVHNLHQTLVSFSNKTNGGKKGERNIYINKRRRKKERKKKGNESDGLSCVVSRWKHPGVERDLCSLWFLSSSAVC